MGLRFIYGAARDAHLAGNLGGRAALNQLRLNSVHINLWYPPTVDTALPGGGDAFGLALPTPVGLELGEDAKHIEERLARRRGRVHGLFGCGQMRALGLQVRDNGLQIAETARQTIDTRDHQYLARVDEIEDRFEFRPAWLADVIARISSDMPVSRLHDLLTWEWNAETPQVKAA